MKSLKHVRMNDSQECEWYNSTNESTMSIISIWKLLIREKKKIVFINIFMSKKYWSIFVNSIILLNCLYLFIFIFCLCSLESDKRFLHLRWSVSIWRDNCRISSLFNKFKILSKITYVIFFIFFFSHHKSKIRLKSNMFFKFIVLILFLFYFVLFLDKFSLEFMMKMIHVFFCSFIFSFISLSLSKLLFTFMCCDFCCFIEAQIDFDEKISTSMTLISTFNTSFVCDMFRIESTIKLLSFKFSNKKEFCWIQNWIYECEIAFFFDKHTFFSSLEIIVSRVICSIFWLFTHSFFVILSIFLIFQTNNILQTRINIVVLHCVNIQFIFENRIDCFRLSWIFYSKFIFFVKKILEFFVQIFVFLISRHAFVSKKNRK